MSTQTRTTKKAGPKAAPKTTPKAVVKAAPKAAPEQVAAVEPKVVPLAVVEEAAAVETPAAATPAAATPAVETPTVETPAVETLAVTTAAIETGTAAMAKGVEDFAETGKEGVDAFVKAGEVLAKGAEELTRTCFDLCQDVATAHAEATAAMLAATSLEELVSVQNELARKTFDRSVAEGERISGMSLKIANEAFGPIQAQFTVAVEKALKPLAA